MKLAEAAIKKGITVRFTRVVDMINDLNAAQVDGTLGRALRAYTSPMLLCMGTGESFFGEPLRILLGYVLYLAVDPRTVPKMGARSVLFTLVAFFCHGPPPPGTIWVFEILLAHCCQLSANYTKNLKLTSDIRKNYISKKISSLFSSPFPFPSP